MPGTPLYQPPLGPVGNATLWTVIGAVLGAVSAWPANGVGGTFLGSGLGAAAVVLVNVLAARLSPKVLPALVIGGLFMLLPFVGLFVPLLGIFRWAVQREEEQHRERSALLARLVVPFILGLAVAGIAATTLYPADARAILQRMNVMIQAGQGAAGVPDALRDPEVGDFSAHGRGAYTLEWTKTDLNRFRIPRPLARFDEHSVAVARFANGWVLACLFVAPDWEPTCKGY